MHETILIVNDDLYFAARLESVLRNSGYIVVTARTVSDATAKSDQASLALVNLNSRKLGGVEAVRALRVVAAELPIVAFLSHTLIPAVRDEVLAAGAHSIHANSAVTMRLPAIVAAALGRADAGDLETDVQD